jgi:hypothetical protein
MCFHAVVIQLVNLLKLGAQLANSCLLFVFSNSGRADFRRSRTAGDVEVADFQLAFFNLDDQLFSSAEGMLSRLLIRGSKELSFSMQLRKASTTSSHALIAADE